MFGIWEKTMSKEKQCPECGCRFQPTNGNQLYCSKQCVKAHQYRQFKASPKYEEFKRRKRDGAVKDYKFSGCPYSSGAIRMPDGGRMPDAVIGF